MNWKAGDKDCRLDVGGHFSLLARELKSEGLESKLRRVWAGCVPGSCVCISLGCAGAGGWGRRLWGVLSPGQGVPMWSVWHGGGGE